jgi:hypothetical protein
VLEVSNPDKSRDVMLEQVWNIEPMFVELEVSNPDKFMDVMLEQPRNI